MDGVQRDEFQTAFWSAKLAMAEAAETAFNHHGVRAGQQFILECLWQSDGLTPGEIAKRLRLATPTVTRAATRMEAAGLLHRKPHPTDARLVRLCLTDRGKHLESTLARERAALTRRAVRGLSESDQAHLIKLLYLLRDNLRSA
ncbi:MAG: MarR family transcriptional regulator, organic hydroperoxide resistance regulator [Micromonosporaceae bacterium]